MGGPFGERRRGQCLPRAPERIGGPHRRPPECPGQAIPLFPICIVMLMRVNGQLQPLHSQLGWRAARLWCPATARTEKTRGRSGRCGPWTASPSAAAGPAETRTTFAGQRRSSAKGRWSFKVGEDHGGRRKRGGAYGDEGRWGSRRRRVDRVPEREGSRGRVKGALAGSRR